MLTTFKIVQLLLQILQKLKMSAESTIMVKLEPEEENEINLFLTNQHLVLNSNPIKEESGTSKEENDSNPIDNNHLSATTRAYDDVQLIENVAYHHHYSLKSNLQIHCVVDKSKNEYKCDHCSFLTNSRSSLIQHTAIHELGTSNIIHVQTNLALPRDKDILNLKYKCDHCNYSTWYQSNLTSHLTKHNLINTYKCDQCEYSTHSKSNLKTHYLKHKYKCEYCKFSTKWKLCLSSHYNTHNIKKHKCEQCSYSTPFNSNFQTHLNKHYSNVEYKCDKCEYSTKWKLSFTRHSATHNVPTKYKCNQCTYSAQNKTHLTKHFYEHMKNQLVTNVNRPKNDL